MEKLQAHPFLTTVGDEQQILVKSCSVCTYTFAATRPCQVLKSSDNVPLLLVFFGPEVDTEEEQGMLMTLKAQESRLSCDMIGMLSKNGGSFSFWVTLPRPGRVVVDFLEKKNNFDIVGEALNEVNVIEKFETLAFDYDKRSGRKMCLSTVVDQSTGTTKTLIAHQQEGIGLKRENLRIQLRVTPEQGTAFASEFNEGSFWCQDRIIRIEEERAMTFHRSLRSLSRRRVSSSRNSSRSLSRPRDETRRRRGSRSSRRSLSRRRDNNRNCRQMPTNRARPNRRRSVRRARSRVARVNCSRRRSASSSYISRTRSMSVSLSRSRGARMNCSRNRSARACRSRTRERSVCRARSRSVSRPSKKGGGSGPRVSGVADATYDFVVRNLKVGKLTEGDLAVKVNARYVYMNPDYRRARSWVIDLGVADFTLTSVAVPIHELLRCHRAKIEVEAAQVSANLKQFVANECVVCLDAPVQLTFVPCGHRCVCRSCCGLKVGERGVNTRVTTCVICRSHVDAYLLGDSA
mmetsp:Transcript_13645/g.22534  ORF Transcript_13645/g.22534 Transcript_13645/m.22534 type:complete len:519 (-) Transcript_13645:248-1804(-)